MPTYLLGDGEIASTAFTSELGSFFIEGRRDRPIELRLLLDERREIAVCLDPVEGSPN